MEKYINLNNCKISYDYLKNGSMNPSSVINAIEKICNGNISNSDDTEKANVLPFKLKAEEIRSISSRKVRERNAELTN